MQRSANYETDNGAISIRPNMKIELDEKTNKNKVTTELAYITIFTNTGKVHINRELVKEIREILEAIEDNYINKA